MAEILSRQVSRIAATSTGYGKRLPSDQGRLTCITFTSPATAAWANGDTIASGVVLPVGTRFPVGSQCSHEGMGASVVVDVGTRDPVTLTAIDADGIASTISVASAGRDALNSGAFVKSGAEYVTTAAAEIYATLSGATPNANAQIRFDIFVILPS